MHECTPEMGVADTPIGKSRTLKAHEASAIAE